MFICLGSLGMFTKSDNVEAFSMDVAIVCYRLIYNPLTFFILHLLQENMDIIFEYSFGFEWHIY